MLEEWWSKSRAVLSLLRTAQKSFHIYVISVNTPYQQLYSASSFSSYNIISVHNKDTIAQIPSRPLLQSSLLTTYTVGRIGNVNMFYQECRMTWDIFSLPIEIL